VIDISVWGGSDAVTTPAVIDRVRTAAEAGLGAIWFPQTAGLDVLTALAVAGAAVPGIRMGTAVVPIQGRHPIPLAQQALTVADAAGPGRFTLGIGVTHAVVSEGWYGIPYRGIVDLCAEEVEALAALLSPARHTDLTGAHLVARMTIGVAVAPPGLVLAALGPRMLDIAGAFTDGTVTWMTGPKSLDGSVVPRIRQAASSAGRPAPRVIAGLPVCLTASPEEARARLAPSMAGAATMPSYRRMLAVEGASDPTEIALVGDEAALEAGVARLEHSGATELLANVVGTADEQARTRAFLASLGR